MTDNDSRLDARVRQALTTLPLPDERDTHDALLTVLERSRGTQGLTTGRWTAPVAAAAAVIAVAGAVGVGALVADERQDPAPAGPPESVVGTWQRRLPASTPGPWAGRWTMALTADGVLRLTGPTGAPSGEGASYSTTPRQLRLDAFVNDVCAELPAGTYRWEVGDTVLDLALVEDPCSTRSGLFVGTWHRVP